MSSGQLAGNAVDNNNLAQAGQKLIPMVIGTIGIVVNCTNNGACESTAGTVGEYIGDEISKNQKERDKLFSELFGDSNNKEQSVSTETEVSQVGAGAPLPPDPDDRFNANDSKTRDSNWWKKNGYDPHKFKAEVLKENGKGRVPVSHYDMYVHRSGEILLRRKGTSQFIQTGRFIK